MVGGSFLTHFESPFILETSMLVKVGPVCFLFREKLDLTSQVVKIDSDRSPSYKSPKMTMGSFHGFGNQSTLSW